MNLVITTPIALLTRAYRNLRTSFACNFKKGCPLTISFPKNNPLRRSLGKEKATKVTLGCSSSNLPIACVHPSWHTFTLPWKRMALPPCAVERFGLVQCYSTPFPHSISDLKTFGRWALHLPIRPFLQAYMPFTHTLLLVETSPFHEWLFVCLMIHFHEGYVVELATSTR